MQRVVVVGDLMVDRRLEGEMSRISPEAPSPVVKITSPVQDTAGGAANVAANIDRLRGGAEIEIRLVGILGPDREGASFRELLPKRVKPYFVTAPARCRTTVKARVTCGGQQVMRLDTETVPSNCGDEVIRMWETALGVQGTDLVVIADYAKGTLPPRVAQQIIHDCSRQGIPVFVDAKPPMYENYAGATLVKPNEWELFEAARRISFPAGGCGDAIRALITRHRFGAVVVTLGRAGATWVDQQDCPNRELGAVPPHRTANVPPQYVFDPTGAGDTFMASLAVSFLEGSPLIDAVPRANLAAGLAVKVHGTTTISRDRVDEAEFYKRDSLRKIVPMEEAAAIVKRWQRIGYTVAFTNGCFDLFHPGHLHLLRKASETAGRLVVGVNTDGGVRELKGEGRPCVPLVDRMAQLRACEYVDLVVAFDESPMSTISWLKPDVLVKGAEYRETEIPGANFVASKGGQVVLVDMLAGYSTTALLES